MPISESDVLQITAFSEEDQARIKKKIEDIMLSNMEPYFVTLPSEEGKILARLKEETVLRELYFDEELEMYKCSGYIFPDYPLNGEISKYSSQEGEQHV